MSTLANENQIRMALTLYRERGEWDGRSIEGARRVLAQARYRWSPEVRKVVERIVRQHHGDMKLGISGRRPYGDARGTVSQTLEQTRALRSKVEPKFLPLFDHLVHLAEYDMGRGNAKMAGRHLRKARQLAGENSPMRPAAQSQKVNRRWLGEKMMHWHSSMGDPYYAVGSFYHGDHVYPNKEVVEQALSQAEVDAEKADRGEHGWTKRDAGELRTIARGLRYYLKHDYAGGAHHASRSHGDLHGHRVYPQWEAKYSNEAFDRAQQLAMELTDEDRREGRSAPRHGYSEPNFAKAERIVRAARNRPVSY